MLETKVRPCRLRFLSLYDAGSAVAVGAADGRRAASAVVTVAAVLLDLDLYDALVDLLAGTAARSAESLAEVAVAVVDSRDGACGGTMALDK